MILALTIVLMFGFGASTTRLITKDSLLTGFRDRWTEHFSARQARLLGLLNAETQFRHEALRNFTVLANKNRLPTEQLKVETLTQRQRHDAMLTEVGVRADEEPWLTWWVTHKRDWVAASNKLVWLQDLVEAISCPWCVGFWVYLGTLVWTWGRVFGFAAYPLSQPIALPWDFLLLGGAMSARWVYALIAMRWDSGH
jgi:hypothetical protein